MKINIESKISIWKNKLLDLGKRNRLLNYKETKRSSLQLLQPDCISLWQSFVQDEKPLEFPYVDEFSTDLFDESFHSVKTNQAIKEMQKTLRNLRDKAKTATEEQGTNILYLSFGFLKWKESENSDYILSSPIILVPAKLTVESISSPYILSLYEDEIVVNPTLCHKLENDFGITLPEYTEDADIKQYLESVQQLVSRNKWEVVFDASLSLLSFLKINMFKDLEWHKDKIKQNPIVRAISGDADACEKIPEELVDFDFDNNLKPTQVFQVVDADSSQMDAILCAKRGISFVLQGPPGTGKSQTITNIISECLADGKKVLFVSEKMAALEVVHRRLTNAELDDFCLILHSHKANKRVVLDQLGNVLKIAERKIQLSDEAYQKLNTLQSDKEKLNDYANQLVETVAPLNKSIFEANGILAHLESYDEIIFSIANIDKITQEEYNNLLYQLEQFSNTIGKMSEDYSQNPWNEATVATVTYELRHDIGAKLPVLFSKVSNAIQSIKKIYEDLNLQWGCSYSALQQLILILDIAKQSPTVPISWINGNEITPLFDEITKCEQIKRLFLQKQHELETQYQIVFANDSATTNLNTKNLTDTVSIQEEVEQIKSILSQLPYSKWDLANTRLFSLFEEAKQQSAKLNELRATIVSQFENGIFSIDFQGIYDRYKTDYNTFFRFLKKQYRQDKKAIQVHYQTIVKKVTDEMILDILIQLRKYSELTKWFAENHEELTSYFSSLYTAETTDFKVIENYFSAFKALKNADSLLIDMQSITATIEREENSLTENYEFLYKGLNTKWEEIRESLHWATKFRQQVAKNNLNNDFIEKVCSDPETIQLCKQYTTDIQRITSDIDNDFLWFLSLFDEKKKIKYLPLPALQDTLERCKDNLFLLEEWIDFRSARENCKNAGLSDFIAKIDDLHLDKSHIIPCFKKRFFRLWLDAILPNYPAVLEFRRRTHESTINEFSELDRQQFAIAKAIIKSKLIKSLPQMNHFTSGFDEIGILKREMNKQRKIMPVRKLFKAIPNLLLTLKPCLMMSPLSVSLFLEADTYMFDVVIFDEASQVCTENAIGAIFRGKQVIITGDSKQLPPTNFFTASTSDIEFDTDDEEEEDGNVYESILDEANLLPERTLLWHYRSRNENLIAFSNAKIYRSNLITFPSNKENTQDNGVEYVFVEKGFYDRGGKAGNIPEAKKVAELVFEHFRKQPNRSLGVIAFGEVQQQAIDGEIRLMRLQNQQYEHFFNEETNEPFFIKNLENVQGDERDTIIFSIGYAKDASGVFRMNFGPLSKLGGERRLNVAITRAKFNIKLVGSIMPTDIITEKISSDGPKLLRSYIDFAINGVESLARETSESDYTWHDSPFEEAVFNFLDRKGYKLGTQVGCSGYRIDMAVKHPTLSGIYVLGIECDGAAYHSARTARERDRLRQDVLENMGWKIYRIWSTDWIKDPITEGNKLINTIKNAISIYGTTEPQLQEDSEIDPGDFITEELHIMDLEQAINPYQFEEYKETDFSNLPRNSWGYLELTVCITEAVKNEFPLHYELLCQKVAHLYGNLKATIKIRREVDYALQQLGNNIYRRDDFLYPSKGATIVVKMPNNRTINHIAVEEIAATMIKILSHCFGTNREGLLSETRKVYGFGSAGQNITSATNAAYELLIKSKKIKLIDDKITLCNK